MEEFDLPRIAVVIPAYQARAHIQSVLDELPGFVSTIIVVDDCSPDETSEIVVAQQKKDPRILLIRNSRNLGVGGAMLAGYAAAIDAGAEIVIKIDSDDQMDPGYILPLIDPIIKHEADFTKGNRFLHENELRRMPWARRIGNLGLSFMTKVASGYWNIFDPTNGFTAIRVDVIKMLNFERISKRYFFEISMLLELGIQRIVVKDIYIPAKYGREQSHLSEWKTLLEFPPKLIRGVIRRLIYLYFIRDFTAITVFLIFGLISVIFGSIWGIYHWWKSYYYGIEASTGTVMIAILPLMMGVQFLLQAIVMDIQNTPEKNK